MIRDLTFKDKLVNYSTFLHTTVQLIQAQLCHGYPTFTFTLTLAPYSYPSSLAFTCPYLLPFLENLKINITPYLYPYRLLLP